MAYIKITKQDIISLEQKANLAYEILKRAVEVPEPSLISSAECLYEHDLGAYLSKLITKSTAEISSLRKGGKRAKPIEKFILQYLLMHKGFSQYDDGNYQTSLTRNMDDNMGGLKVYLDAEDLHPKRVEMFKIIQNISTDLRKEKKYNLILNCMDYVRKK